MAIKIIINWFLSGDISVNIFFIWISRPPGFGHLLVVLELCTLVVNFCLRKEKNNPLLTIKACFVLRDHFVLHENELCRIVLAIDTELFRFFDHDDFKSVLMNPFSCFNQGQIISRK